MTLAYHMNRLAGTLVDGLPTLSAAAAAARWAGVTTLAGGVPTVVGMGATNIGTTGSVTYDLPAGHQAGDLLVLLVAAAETAALGTPSGWAVPTNAPVVRDSNVLGVNIYYRRATSASETAPIVPSSINHQIGATIAFRGVAPTGDPWDYVPVASSGHGASPSFSSGVTTGPDRLALLLAGAAADTTVNQYGVVSNAALTSLTVQRQVHTDTGNGSGILVVTGVRSTAGSTGTFTSDLAASQGWAGLALALRPIPASLVPSDLSLVGSLNAKAGNVLPNYRDLQGVLNQLAGTSGLAVDGAAKAIP